jgi:glutathione S-transferase
MITLHGIPRSRAMRALWMLEELGVPYRNEKVSFAGGTRTPEFLKLNPNGHIPVLQDGDFVLWESMAINLYLARRYGEGLWPRTVEGEGHAFQWSVWAMTELEEPVITTFLHRVMLPAEQRDPARADAAAERFRAPLGVLESRLAGREYLLGPDFTVADLNVASVICLAPLVGLDLSGAPAVQGWLGRCTARPAFARVQQMAS